MNKNTPCFGGQDSHVHQIYPLNWGSFHPVLIGKCREGKGLLLHRSCYGPVVLFLFKSCQYLSKNLGFSLQIHWNNQLESTNIFTFFVGEGGHPGPWTILRVTSHNDGILTEAVDPSSNKSWAEVAAEVAIESDPSLPVVFFFCRWRNVRFFWGRFFFF